MSTFLQHVAARIVARKVVENGKPANNTPGISSLPARCSVLRSHTPPTERTEKLLLFVGTITHT
jgi:hypothetical protein